MPWKRIDKLLLSQRPDIEISAQKLLTFFTVRKGIDSPLTAGVRPFFAAIALFWPGVSDPSAALEGVPVSAFEAVSSSPPRDGVATSFKLSSSEADAILASSSPCDSSSAPVATSGLVVFRFDPACTLWCVAAFAGGVAGAGSKISVGMFYTAIADSLYFIRRKL